MNLRNILLKISLKFLFAGLIFCALAVSTASGQTAEERILSDKERKELPYHPQTSENQLDKSTKPSGDRSFSGYTREENTTKKPKYKEMGERENLTGEASSEEVSTLSFNIFLYVLDRFKED